MHQTWQDILSADDHAPATRTSGLQAVESASVIVPLPEIGVIGAHGPDARAFLNGQLTQQVTDLEEGHWQLAGYCNPKGRLLGLFHVHAEDDGLRLITQRSVTDSLLNRLRMFVLRAQVAVEDRSEHNVAMGLAGPAAADMLAELAGSPPATPGGVVEAGDLRVLRLADADVPRFMLLAPEAEGREAWAMLTRALSPAGIDAWELLAVRAGEPAIIDATQEAFVPQMVNLELIDGVAFNKGCYPGQEVVARLHYRGKPNRRMFRGLLPTAQPPEPGVSVRDGDGNEAGQILRSAANPAGQSEVLAVLQLSKLDEPLTVDGTAMQLVTLPYEVPRG